MIRNGNAFDRKEYRDTNLVDFRWIGQPVAVVTAARDRSGTGVCLLSNRLTLFVLDQPAGPPNFRPTRIR